MNNAIAQRMRHTALHEGSMTLSSIINICIAVAVCALLAYTIAQVNMGAARTIHAAQLNDRIESLQERQSILSAQRALVEERQPLMEFAAAYGMIPVVATHYLTSDEGVAVAPGSALP